MTSITELLYFPAIAAAIGALIVYIVQVFQKKYAIRTALEAEINSILADTRENLEFLERNDHYWLRPGTTITHAPKPFAASTKIYAALLPELPLLGADNLRRVLAFYSFYEFCENLRSSLFTHVANYATTKCTLASSDVEILRSRRNRLCAAYRHLDSSLPKMVALRHLKPSYELPGHQELVSTMQIAFQPSESSQPDGKE
jgi:hypothetical protein